MDRCRLFLCVSRFVEVPCVGDEEMEEQFPSALVEELFSLMLLVGRLRDLPANVQSAFSIHHQGKVSVGGCDLLQLVRDVLEFPDHLLVEMFEE